MSALRERLGVYWRALVYSWTLLTEGEHRKAVKTIAYFAIVLALVAFGWGVIAYLVLSGLY